VSTHYMEEAEYCHRLALLNRGRLIALDTPRALRTRSDETILEVETADAAGAVHALVGRAHVADAAMYGRAVHVTVDDADEGPAAVVAHLRVAGIDTTAVTRIEPSLEDVFTSLVRAEGGAVVG